LVANVSFLRLNKLILRFKRQSDHFLFCGDNFDRLIMVDLLGFWSIFLFFLFNSWFRYNNAVGRNIVNWLVVGVGFLEVLILILFNDSVSGVFFLFHLLDKLLFSLGTLLTRCFLLVRLLLWRIRCGSWLFFNLLFLDRFRSRCWFWWSYDRLFKNRGRIIWRRNISHNPGFNSKPSWKY